MLSLILVMAVLFAIGFAAGRVMETQVLPRVPSQYHTPISISFLVAMYVLGSAVHNILF